MKDPLLEIFDIGVRAAITIAKNKLIVTTFLGMAFLGGVAITTKAFIDGDMFRFIVLGVGTMLYFQLNVASLQGHQNAI